MTKKTSKPAIHAKKAVAKPTAPKKAATLKAHFAARPSPSDKDFVVKQQAWVARGQWLAAQEGVRFGPI